MSKKVLLGALLVFSIFIFAGIQIPEPIIKKDKEGKEIIVNKEEILKAKQKALKVFKSLYQKQKEKMDERYSKFKEKQAQMAERLKALRESQLKAARLNKNVKKIIHLSEVEKISQKQKISNYLFSVLFLIAVGIGLTVAIRIIRKKSS